MKGLAKLTAALALAALVCVPAGPAALGGILDTLKSRAEEETRKRAAEAVAKKVGEKLTSGVKADAPPEEAQDQFMGEYVGAFITADGKSVPGIAKVATAKPGTKDVSYQAVLTAVESGLVQQAVLGKDAKVAVTAQLSGQADGPRVTLKGGAWSGSISDGRLAAEAAGAKFDLKFIVRKSPTELAPPPAGAVVLLPYAEGKAPSLEEWTNQKWPAFTDGSVMVQGGNNLTKRQFKDFKLHLEFRIPTDGRGGGNSGVYILDRYEIQIFDSFAKPPNKGGCAAVYQTFPPEVNASLPRGRWQTYDITFRAARMEGDKVVKLPVVTVEHNGVTAHKDVEIPHATGNAQKRGHAASGPIHLQDHGSAGRFRNIWIVEVKN